MSVSKIQKIKNFIGKSHFVSLGTARNFLTIAEILPFFFKSSLKIPSFPAPLIETKNSRNILQNIDLQRVEFKLNEFLAQKNYIDEELRLPDFAAAIGLSTHQASYYLNQYLNMSFTEFLQFHRINEVKNMMRIKLNYNLLNIAFECGFNSASSFHRACVKFTGKSPRDLRQELLSNIETQRKVE
ncbi:helix-turn-helix domain-containing protein [Leptospira noguchii]|uniref:helix-turn-helix domain-containing protein n=1 Tax=Leptospira noguchii TaxID=28182 RepID=UPI001FB796A2|nr:helix-turn-helix domain-containing protein [Leptospira noguchii]UOG43615.1 helix-turn-helix domain-containing protein [Leptospira noguchii]UOG62594.1 helix-turn-helix domain-containing protein [Leptospira noguchii]